MEIRYRREDVAKMLGLTAEEMAQADARPELAFLGGTPEVYGPEHISAYRKVLGLYPPRRSQRRQLFLNFKGGTGKTSLSVAYAYRMAEFGYRVLLIDLDSQGHATQHLGIDGEQCERTLYDVLVHRVPLEEVVLHTPLDEFDLIPANLGMTTADMALMPMAGREFRLAKALEAVAGRYDFIVMDAPPSFGLLNLNALIATDDLFVPVLPDFLSFRGLKLLFETVGELEEDLGHSLQRIFIVLNQYNPTTRIAREAKSALETHYSEYLLKTIVRQSTQFAQASSEGMPISAYAPSMKGAEDIDALIDEVLRYPVPDAQQERIA
ncbi:MAG TPA: ParA family protein [Longimicrobiales bacterium]|nr:ParA family protein [Longimicrobiales bacterium]